MNSGPDGYPRTRSSFPYWPPRACSDSKSPSASPTCHAITPPSSQSFTGSIKLLKFVSKDHLHDRGLVLRAMRQQDARMLRRQGYSRLVEPAPLLDRRTAHVRTAHSLAYHLDVTAVVLVIPTVA